MQVPSQVTGLTLSKVVRSGATVLWVTWTTPQGNVTIYQYRVQYKLSGTTTWRSELIVLGSPPPTSTILTGLNAGIEYNVRVKAVSAVGAGNWSEEQSETTYMCEIFSYTYSV